MKINEKIVSGAAAYVAAYLQKYLSKDFCYHDFDHTFSVVNAVNLLCASAGVSKANTKILSVAAWFHDTGYVQQSDGHEMISAFIAEKYLEQYNVDIAQINLVKKCILVTRYPQYPENELERIICDADMFHLSETNLPGRSQMLRREWEKTKHLFFSDREWYALNLQFLSKHVFHSPWLTDHFKSGVLKNLAFFKNRLNEMDQTSGIEVPKTKIAAKEKK